MEMSTLGGGEDEDGNEIEGEPGDPEVARQVFQRGYKDLRARAEKEDVSDISPVAIYRLCGITASTFAGSVEIVRRAEWHRRETDKGPRNDAYDSKEMAQGGGWFGQFGRMYVWLFGDVQDWGD